jgi:hypothetical protein
VGALLPLLPLLLPPCIVVGALPLLAAAEVAAGRRYGAAAATAALTMGVGVGREAVARAASTACSTPADAAWWPSDAAAAAASCPGSCGGCVEAAERHAVRAVRACALAVSCRAAATPPCTSCNTPAAAKAPQSASWRPKLLRCARGGDGSGSRPYAILSAKDPL